MFSSNLYRGILTQSYPLHFMLRKWWGRLLLRRQSTRKAQNSLGRWGRTPPCWQNCFSFNFSDWNAVCDFSGLVWWNTRNPGDSHTMQSNWRGNPINRAMAEQQNPWPVHCLKRARSVGTWAYQMSACLDQTTRKSVWKIELMKLEFKKDINQKIIESKRTRSVGAWAYQMSACL